MGRDGEATCDLEVKLALAGHGYREQFLSLCDALCGGECDGARVRGRGRPLLILEKWSGGLSERSRIVCILSEPLYETGKLQPVILSSWQHQALTLITQVR